MKHRHSWLALASIIVTLLAFAACQDNNEEGKLAYPTALVTVKPGTGTTPFILQLNDSTSLMPYNMRTSPFGDKEVRALVNYDVMYSVGQRSGGAPVKDATFVTINWIDSIRTKWMAPNLGDRNVKLYGDDPLEVVDDWVSIAEDGYLTLHFRTRWNGKVRHVLNLVATSDNDNIYKVRLYHDAKGDLYGQTGDGLIAFRLDNLPYTGEKYVWLTLEWNSYSGKKTARFKYSTRENSVITPTKLATFAAPVQITNVD